MSIFTLYAMFILQLSRLFGLVPECRTVFGALWIATEVEKVRNRWGQVKTVEDWYEQA